METLSTALVRRQKLRFHYTNAKNRRRHVRTVRPLHLAQVKGGWYLFAWDEKPEDIRIFALPRIKNLELLEEAFEHPSTFDLTGYLQGSMGLITDPNAPVTHLILRFTGYAAVLVSERNWHPSQEIEPQTDGGILLHLRLQHTGDIPGWVLSWGGLAEIVSPPALRDALARKAKALAALHQK